MIEREWIGLYLKISASRIVAYIKLCLDVFIPETSSLLCMQDLLAKVAQSVLVDSEIDMLDTAADYDAHCIVT